MNLVVGNRVTVGRLVVRRESVVRNKCKAKNEGYRSSYQQK